MKTTAATTLAATAALAALSVLQPFSPSALSASASPRTRTDYSIAGIVQPARSAAIADDAKSADADLAASIGSAQLLYTGDGSALRAVRDARNRLKLPTPVIVYMGGITTNPNTDIADLEKNYRSAIAMTPVAKLSGDIDATATRITLMRVDPAGDVIAVKASTADVSEKGSSTKFCFWLRIDDELMRVTAVDLARQRPIVSSEATGSTNRESKIENSLSITVERGFSNTTPAAHKAHARALSPVYLGSNTDLHAARHSNSWPGGPDELRYALDPRQPAAQKFKGNLITGFMREGYDGAWLDTFQPRPYNFCDAIGRKVTFFWDFKTAAPYTPATYLEAIKEYIRGVRAFTRAAVGHEPVLFANSASGSYTNGTKELFNHGDMRDLMDGYCFEDSYLRVDATRDKKSHGATQAAFHPITGDKWLVNVTNHADAASSGLRAYCMAGTAGYLAQFINRAQPNYAQLLRYAYASFLLTVTKERTTMFGWPMHVSENKNSLGIVPWPRVFFIGIGDPIQPNKIADLKLSGSPCYQRRFENGLVIVNPSREGAPPAAVTIPEGYIDAMTGKPAPTQLTLAAADAAILIRAR